MVTHKRTQVTIPDWGSNCGNLTSLKPILLAIVSLCHRPYLLRADHRDIDHNWFGLKTSTTMEKNGQLRKICINIS
jgi:hypothetical protein